MTINIAVIGAGIIGLPTAWKILQDIDGCKVTVFADEFSPNTTGDISGGLIFPYLCNFDKVKSWFIATLERMTELHKREDAFDIGVLPFSGYHINPTVQQIYCLLPNYQRITEKETDVVFAEGDGWKFSTWTCYCPKYLKWISGNFTKLGGKLERRHIENFEELSDFDVIVNCSGMSARYLAKDDKVIPIRGQAMIVKAPWIRQGFINGTTYVLPRVDDVMLGGTTQKGDYNKQVCRADSERIWRDCKKVYPSLKYSELIAEKVGLRPHRDPVRLELEIKPLNGRQIPILHNYGHGGSGVGLHWGCALESCEILSKYLQEQKLKSKL